jgi:hypothetical protein
LRAQRSNPWSPLSLVIASAAKQSPFQSQIVGSAEPAAQTFEWVLEIASLRSQ